MTELEAKHIQNSINVLQELLDAHHASLNKTRPQEKGLLQSIPNFNILWNISGNILDHIEVSNTGPIPIIAYVYQINCGSFLPLPELNVPLDGYGSCIGSIHVNPTRSEMAGIGYPCSGLMNVIMIQIKDLTGEILKTLKVE
jgi:hypothetical protein